MCPSDRQGIDLMPDSAGDPDYRRLIALVEQSPMDPVERGIARAAIEAYLRGKSDSGMAPSDLADIRLAARHRSLRLFEVGIELFILLFHKHGEIAAEWQMLAVSPHAEQRRRAVAMLSDYRVPYEFAVAILRRAVRDRSIVVREFAISSARSRKAIDILSELRASGGLPSMLPKGSGHDVAS